MYRSLFFVALIFLTALSIGLNRPTFADEPPKINLNFPASDGMTVTDILKVVAMETGAIILPDNSVNGAVGAIHTAQTSVPDTLDFLKGYEPGLTWQVIYYPSSSNYEPDGEVVYQAIQMLQGLNLDGLVLPPMGDDKVQLMFKKQMYTTPEQEKTDELGFTAYYLVTDNANRQLMAKAAKTPNPAPVTQADRPAHFITTLNDLQNQIAQLTPQQQVTALNQMANASRQIMATLSPQVLATLRTQNTGQKQGQ